MLVWRRPSLRRLSRTDGFRDWRRTAADWIDGQFREIGLAATGLAPIGFAVTDHCSLGRPRSAWFPQHIGPLYVRCDREVTGIYGLSGDPAARLAELATAVGSAGWYVPGYTSVVAPLREQLAGPLRARGIGSSYLRWRLQPGAEPPPGWHDPGPPLSPKPEVVLHIQAELGAMASGRPPADGLTRLADQRMTLPTTATDLELPLERSEADVAALVQRALEHSDAVLALRISFIYLAARYTAALPFRLGASRRVSNRKPPS
jgi:hypothetical protein